MEYHIHLAANDRFVRWHWSSHSSVVCWTSCDYFSETQ